MRRRTGHTGVDPELAVGEAWLAKHRASINPAWAVRYDDALAGLAPDESLESRAARERFETAVAFLNASAAAPRRSLGAVIAVVGILFSPRPRLRSLVSRSTARPWRNGIVSKS